MAKKERISAQDVLETISGFIEVFDVEKLQKLDLLDNLSSMKTSQSAMERRLTAVEQKLSEVVKPDDFEQKLKERDDKFNKAIKAVPTEVQVKNEPVCLAQKDRDSLDELNFQIEKHNKRFSQFCRVISGKKIWFLILFLMTSLSVGTTFLIMKDSAAEWAHRALVAAEGTHKKEIVDEYSKAYTEMRGNRKARKAAKKHIEGMESEAEYIGRLERILSDYTEEELEVWEYIYRLKSEQMVHLTCYHPSSNQKVKYRLYTTPEGTVTKVEMEKKIKNKSVWEELKLIVSE